MIPAADAAWRFIADTVMGGVSTGEMQFEDGALRLTGAVSTANNGGFIQARTELPDGFPADTTALRLRVRGNGARYFIHLRTTTAGRPWHYFQGGFDTGPDWAEVTLPFATFRPAGRMPVATFRPGDIRSMGLVAFGRDHSADVSLAAFAAV
jgi:hypothetical protein